jgi:hypothetical protein
MGNSTSKKEMKQTAASVARKSAKVTPKATRVISKRLSANHNQTFLVD